MTIVFTRAKLAKLKLAYEACKPGETFTFEGKEVLKEYAHYLILHLETEL